MMYGTLAQFYDALVKDEEATQAWVSLIEEYVNGKEVLELACGSGEITIAGWLPCYWNGYQRRDAAGSQKEKRS